MRKGCGRVLLDQDMGAGDGCACGHVIRPQRSASAGCSNFQPASQKAVKPPRPQRPRDTTPPLKRPSAPKQLASKAYFASRSPTGSSTDHEHPICYICRASGFRPPAYACCALCSRGGSPSSLDLASLVRRVLYVMRSTAGASRFVWAVMLDRPGAPVIVRRVFLSCSGPFGVFLGDQALDALG
jgi:hypothetical protein